MLTDFIKNSLSLTGRSPTKRILKHNWAVPIFKLRWYPSSKNCVNTANKKPKPHQMPPLMVRKAEWRR